MISTTESSVPDKLDRPNPFAVPHLRDRSLRPLRPWQHADHRDYYLAVDHTEHAYQRFTKYLADPAVDLTQNGRLVVVTGERGCGKSSVIHRCVHYITEKLPAADRPDIIDLSRESPLDFGEQNFPDSSVNTYLDRLADRVVTELAAKHETFKELKEPVAFASSAYSEIGEKLERRSGFLIILLPPFEDTVSGPASSGRTAFPFHPVRHYMGFRHPRIIFFAESLNPSEVARWYGQLSGEASEDALILKVGPLKGEDGWVFADGRLRFHRDSGVPTVSRDTMVELMRRRRSMSLTALQKLCFDLWAEAADKGLSEISLHDILEYDKLRKGRYTRRQRKPRNEQG